MNGLLCCVAMQFICLAAVSTHMLQTQEWLRFFLSSSHDEPSHDEPPAAAAADIRALQTAVRTLQVEMEEHKKRDSSRAAIRTTNPLMPPLVRGRSPPPPPPPPPPPLPLPPKPFPPPRPLLAALGRPMDEPFTTGVVPPFAASSPQVPPLLRSVLRAGEPAQRTDDPYNNDRSHRRHLNGSGVDGRAVCPTAAAVAAMKHDTFTGSFWGLPEPRTPTAEQKARVRRRDGRQNVLFIMADGGLGELAMDHLINQLIHPPLN